MGLNIKDLKISSQDIQSGAKIPNWASGEGENRPPRMLVSGVPEEAVELALIIHDPDAPLPQGFTHWVVYGIDPRNPEITEDAAHVGPNGMGEQNYTGPYPPEGHGIHQYYFWIYALNRKVSGNPSREQFLDQYADAIIEQNRFVGLYER